MTQHYTVESEQKTGGRAREGVGGMGGVGGRGELSGNTRGRQTVLTAVVVAGVFLFFMFF